MQMPNRVVAGRCSSSGAGAQARRTRISPLPLPGAMFLISRNTLHRQQGQPGVDSTIQCIIATAGAAVIPPMHTHPPGHPLTRPPAQPPTQPPTHQYSRMRRKM